MANSFSGKLFGGKYKKTLYFVPCADKKPKVGHKISEPAIFRFLLNEETLEKFNEADEVEIPEMLEILKDIDKQSEITQVEVYRSSMGSTTDAVKAFHVFIVFKSTSETADDGDYWWSLEKNTEYIFLQRCRNKENVKDKFEGEERNKVKPIKEDLKGKGTIKNLFEILWAHQIIKKKYNVVKSNCQSLVTFVSQQITEIGYEFKGNFKYSPPRESGREKEMLDLILILRVCSDWPPLFILIQMGNTDLVDKTVASANYDINACNNEHQLTPLHFAILLEKTQMVKHLLQPPLSADPTRRDASGRTALPLAALFTMKTEIFDLLLAHGKVKVDDVDGDGRTALHLAADASNVIAVQKLIKKGANPNIVAKNGMSPLHVAAKQRDGCPIIDLLLEANKFKGLGDVNDRDEDGWTALHYAARASNEMTAEHLIQKGADLNRRDNYGRTPLHEAAFSAKDMNIIDVLLNNINEGDMEQYRNDKILSLSAKLNENGLEVKICIRLLEKGIMKVTPSSETDKYSQEIDEVLNLDGNFDINGRDQNGDTPLILAIRTHNVDLVRRLLEKGADPTVRDENGFTPFHLSADSDRDSYILHLLLENDQVDINETTSQQGITALHLAIMNSNLTAAHFLLCRGANPNAANKKGVTPLHLAAMFAKDMDMVELLLNHSDVDVNLMDNEGQNALGYAMENKKGNGERIANLLKEKGAGETENRLPKVNKELLKKRMRDIINRKYDEIENCVADNTLPIGDKIDTILENKDYLVSAFKDSDVEGVRLLLKNGADTKTFGEEGANVLHLASRDAEKTDLIDVILETGKFDINGVDSNGNTPLYYAITGINLERNARHLIGKGADPTIANKNGHTALHMAAFHAKSIETVSLLLGNKQVDINHIDDKIGVTALHCATMSENVEMVRYLLEKGADPTIRDQNGCTSFHMAVMFLTDTHVLDLMLENEKKIDIDEKNNDGFNALHMAIIKSNVDSARFLLSKGANPIIVDGDGRTPLQVAAMFAKDMDIFELLLDHKDMNENYLNNNVLLYAMTNLMCEEMAAKLGRNNHEPKNIAEPIPPGRINKEDSDMDTIRFLIESGIDISATTWGEYEANALHLAAKNGETTDIDVILDTGKFDINAVDKNGLTPLHYAIMGTNCERNARHLIGKGADPNIAEKNGHTPLHMAARYTKSIETVSLILANKQVNINQREKVGATALHHAIFAENVEMVRYLLEKGADPTIRDKNGCTSFHVAAQFLTADTDVNGLMLENEKKIGIDEKDKNGITALHMAILWSNVTAARFLLSNGANPNVVGGDGRTPLQWAVYEAKDLDIVKLLVNHPGVDFNYLDNYRQSALDYAISNKHGLGEAIANLLMEKMAANAQGNNRESENTEAFVPGGIKEDSDMKTIRLLIEDGQDISEMTWGDNGANALHLVAADEKAAEFIDVILETGKFDINGIDNDGRTPLHYAIKRPKPITINSRRLIKMGADPNIADKNGVTPLHMAARNAESMDLIELLLNTEAVDVNCVDIKGRTPLACARDNKHGLGQRIIARLKEYDDEKK